MQTRRSFLAAASLVAIPTPFLAAASLVVAPTRPALAALGCTYRESLPGIGELWSYDIDVPLFEGSDQIVTRAQFFVHEPGPKCPPSMLTSASLFLPN